MAGPESVAARRQVVDVLGRLSVPAIFLAFCVGYYLDIRGMRIDASFYPRATILIVVGLLLAAIASEVRKIVAERRAPADPAPPTASGEGEAQPNPWYKALYVVVATGLFLYAMPRLGAVITSAIYAPLLAFLLGYRKPIGLILYALLTAVVVNQVFMGWLMVNLPRGLFSF